MSRVNVVHANTYRDLVCSCRATMRVHACENEVIIELYRTYTWHMRTYIIVMGLPYLHQY